MDIENEYGELIDFRINYNTEDENIKLWNKTMKKYVQASKTKPKLLTQTLLYNLIQSRQIKIEKEFADTKFEIFSTEQHTYVEMCKEK